MGRMSRAEAERDAVRFPVASHTQRHRARPSLRLRDNMVRVNGWLVALEAVVHRRSSSKKKPLVATFSNRQPLTGRKFTRIDLSQVCN